MRKHLPLLVPIFASVLRSADQLAMALEAKGFGAQRQRSSLLQLTMSLCDWLVTVGALAAMGASVWIALGGHLRLAGLYR
jgi:energy-coupling factor transporter transmembrane protein EcfT